MANLGGLPFSFDLRARKPAWPSGIVVADMGTSILTLI
jgi:hypothetical protein